MAGGASARGDGAGPGAIGEEVTAGCNPAVPGWPRRSEPGGVPADIRRASGGHPAGGKMGGGRQRGCSRCGGPCARGRQRGDARGRQGAPLSGAPLSGRPLSGEPLSGTPLSGTPLSGVPRTVKVAGRDSPCAL
ncbi:MAG: hypothetical protein ACK559_10490 [bacterium]